ncbi:hypothetical protein KVL03_03350 [Helicobacter pylori]|nr:hypothetical protein KVL03_03350 [Helicobacter pylori]
MRCPSHNHFLREWGVFKIILTSITKTPQKSVFLRDYRSLCASSFILLG